jgi:hypothetical protein
VSAASPDLPTSTTRGGKRPKAAQRESDVSGRAPRTGTLPDHAASKRDGKPNPVLSGRVKAAERGLAPAPAGHSYEAMAEAR